LATVEFDFHMAETPSAPPRPRYPIESVDSALRLLALVADERAVSLSAAARHLDVAPSTAHRLLAMLEHYRLIERDPATKAYALGPWLSELGRASAGQLDIRPLARPALERLVDRVGETAHLVGLQGADAVFLDCVECNATVRATPRTGQRLPAHCTAGGKAQLAALPRARVLSSSSRLAAVGLPVASQWAQTSFSRSGSSLKVGLC
jgi:DNA-binding IclR family transcriptional regulator